MKILKKQIFLIIILGFLCLLPEHFVEAAEEAQVVRVAFPIQEHLAEKSEDGTYSSYTYEYLMTISQYTGYQYEFIELEGELKEQREKSLEMLENGEVDLVGAMPYEEKWAEKYSYVMNNYGTCGLAIYVEPGNYTLTTTSMYSADNMRLAVCKDMDEEIKALQHFIEEHYLQAELVYVASQEEQLEALENGEADALLANTLDRPSKELRSIRQFDTQPLYFVTTKENEDLTREINTAIAENQENDPGYESTLNKKYFSNPSQKLELTEEEKEYVQSLGTVRVLALGENAPFSYIDRKGKASGLVVNVLEYMEENSGIDFDIAIQENIITYNSLVDEGDAEMIVCRSDMRSVVRSLGYSASRSFLTIPMSLVVHSGNTTDDLENERRAVPYLSSDLEEEDFHGTPEECLEAINSGEAVYGYINAYATDHYTRINNLNNVYVYLQSEEYSESLVIAVNGEVSDQLLPIVNKLLYNLEEETLTEEYLYKNIVDSSEISLLSYVRHNRTEVLLIALVAMTILLLCMMGYRYSLEKKSKKQILQQSRLDGLTGGLVRHAFLEEATLGLKKARKGHPVIFFMIDVDDFKQINDTHGHGCGDRILREIAGALRETFRGEDIVGRIGGDEFGVFVTSPKVVADIDKTMEKLAEKLKHISIRSDDRKITVSAGGVCTEERLEIDQVYEAADRAMYRMKKKGGNNWEIVNCTSQSIKNVQTEEENKDEL